MAVMKKIVTIPSACLLFLILFSCKKNDNGSVTGGTITCTINGTTYVSAGVSEEAIPSLISPAVKFVNVFTSADSSKARSIVLYLDSLTVGTYFYDSTLSNSLQCTIGTNSYFTMTGSRGSIVITSTGTNSITGTFSGVAFIGVIDSVVITNGVFTNCVY